MYSITLLLVDFSLKGCCFKGVPLQVGKMQQCITTLKHMHTHTFFTYFPFTYLISTYKCNLQSALFKLTDTADRVINRQHCGLHFSVHTWQSTEHITMIYIYIYHRSINSYNASNAWESRSNYKGWKELLQRIALNTYNQQIKPIRVAYIDPVDACI